MNKTDIGTNELDKRILESEPYSAEENATKFKALKEAQTDEEKQEILEDILTNNLRLIKFLARNYYEKYSYYISKDEALEMVLYAFGYGMKHYDYEKGTLVTFINGIIIKALWESLCLAQTVPLSLKDFKMFKKLYAMQIRMEQENMKTITYDELSENSGIDSNEIYLLDSIQRQTNNANYDPSTLSDDIIYGNNLIEDNEERLPEKKMHKYELIEAVHSLVDSGILTDIERDVISVKLGTNFESDVRKKYDISHDRFCRIMEVAMEKLTVEARKRGMDALLQG